MDFLSALRALYEKGGGARLDASPFLAYSHLRDLLPEEEKLCAMCLDAWKAFPPHEAFASCQTLPEAKAEAMRIYGALREKDDRSWKKAMRGFITLDFEFRGIPLMAAPAVPPKKGAASLPPPGKIDHLHNPCAGLSRRWLRELRRKKILESRGLVSFFRAFFRANRKRGILGLRKKKREKAARKNKIRRKPIKRP